MSMDGFSEIPLWSARQWTYRKVCCFKWQKHHFSYTHCLGCTKRVKEGATVTNILRNEFIAFGCDIMLFWTRKHHIQKKTMKISNQKGKSQFTDNITCQRLNGQSFLWNAIKTDCKKNIFFWIIFFSFCFAFTKLLFLSSDKE